VASTKFGKERPDGLLAAAPLVLRFAPDRRRALRGSVQPGAAPGCRTGLVCLSAVRTAYFRPDGPGCRNTL